jgi:hypothetical protein
MKVIPTPCMYAANSIGCADLCKRARVMVTSHMCNEYLERCSCCIFVDLFRESYQGSKGRGGGTTLLACEL